MTSRFVPGVKLDGAAQGDAYAFAYRGRRLLVWEEERSARVPRLGELEKLTAERADLVPSRRLYLGTFDAVQIFALELPEAPDGGVDAVPEKMACRGLRSLYMRLDESLFLLAGRAIQIVDWDRDHQYCGRCATATEDHPVERSKRCPSCGLVAHPRLAPAVIVLVERGEEILLGRSPHFPPGMYSTLAGFVEPGETLEEAVEREIHEESGIRVRDIRYFGSQPWPFPHSLMVGFRARYKSGEISLEDDEIEDAGWFTADSLPKIPPKLSIARALIDSFLERA